MADCTARGWNPKLVVSRSAVCSVGSATSSHNHTDHLDAETLGPLLKANPRIAMIAPAANRDSLLIEEA
jgi:L-ascorbate metabolism protein UlaG (beta-lactamase superfamily)